MQSEAQYGLNFDQINGLNQCFASYPAIQSVIIYGSRAMGTYRPGSDIDLSIVTDSGDFLQLSKLEADIDDLLLPYRVDLSVHCDIINADLLNHISRAGKVFYVRL